MSRSPTSSDDEAPEAISFESEKKAAKGRATAIQQFQAQEKQKERQKNRQRDQVLKERASARKRSHGEDVNDESESEDADSISDSPRSRDELEARMDRAMKEAAGESNSDSEDEGDESGHSSDDPETVEEHTALAGSREATSDEEEDRSDSDELQTRRPDYLPDHLFTAAFAQVSSTSSSKRKVSSQKAPVKKRKRARKPNSRDVIVDGRTIRNLAPSSDISTSMPFSGQIRAATATKNFLGRNLNVSGKAQASKLKGWERRSANLGVLRRNGPAAHFVRDS